MSAHELDSRSCQWSSNPPLPPLPALKAALHPPSPSLSFPLILHHLLEPDEAQTGIPSYFHNFPCSDALIPSVHLSPNDSPSTFPAACTGKLWDGPFLAPSIHQPQLHKMISLVPGAHGIIKLEQEQTRAAEFGLERGDL